ncbi:MAG: xanthine dehydrogenase family protein molybdopterin-binding subunit [Acidobacteriota bacterium]|nr:MAG: xanthine dehydrogenase family protein molybdopterin-binding subunit [Acidobacteriota bacterium]
MKKNNPNRSGQNGELEANSQLSEFALRRRTFLQVVGTGVMITVAGPRARAQSGRGDTRNAVSARLFLNRDGTITALSGKVEEGQGPRAELTQAAAEELRVSASQIRLVMADTELVPDDGITAGSRTTPRNIPEMRQAAATARELLTELAARQWEVSPTALSVTEGVVRNSSTGQKVSYQDLAQSSELESLFENAVRTTTTVTPVADWKILGQSLPRPNARDLVTGAHQFPSDIRRPGMLYGKVLRPPSFGAPLESVDLSAAQAMDGVVVFQEGDFVGTAASTTHQAEEALKAIARTAKWKLPVHRATHETVYDHLREHARRSDGRVNGNGSVEEGMAASEKTLSETYTVAYIQHAPMEPRAAVAEWTDETLTVWAGCDGPFRAQNDLREAFGIPAGKVRVIIPDMGGGFGGKHSAEAAVEAARLAKAAGKPVSVRWTREEEFTWAYSRPASVIECKAGLDKSGHCIAWDFTNINAGGSAIDTPYSIANTQISSVGSSPPLRQGSYRCLGATANNFARESFMDELAAATEADPLEFRLAHLQNERLRAVLQEAAAKFKWTDRRKQLASDRGIGLACGTEKNSVVAACVEVLVDKNKGTFKVTEICEAFECGPILNPSNLLSQVHGCIIMGLGGALTEEMEFKDGSLLNAAFSRYRVPRFRDIPKIDVHFLENHSIPPAGGGETPIIAVAPAIGNAVFAATGIRLRAMPMRGLKGRGA